MTGAGRVRISTAVLALCGAFGGATAARSADLLAPPPPVVAVPVAEMSGWYLRGDGTGTFFERPTDATIPDPGQPPLVDLRLGDASGYGGGVGYRLSPLLRVDATFDQRTPSRFHDTSSGSNFVTGYNVEAGKLDVLTGLFTVYADLGTWWGLTPYVGAGLGFAKNAFRNAYTQTFCLAPGCDGQPGSGPRDPVFRANRSTTTFAWNLTAGVSYHLTAGLSLDAAYRRVDFGTAATGLDPFGGITRLKDLAADEVRVGLRYEFAGGLVPQLPSLGLYNNPYGH